MADDNGNKGNFSGLIRTVKPTQLGKPKADLTLSVAKAATKLFRVEDGQVKVPRKRQTSEQWPSWFDELDAPKMLYLYMVDENPNNAVEVTYDEASELFTDADGNQYTGERVVEMADPDAREVKGTPEALQNLRNAITRFNTKTGKKLATRFVKAQRDSTGRTIEQVETVYRLR